jgi:hypothetical protein
MVGPPLLYYVDSMAGPSAQVVVEDSYGDIHGYGGASVVTQIEEARAWHASRNPKNYSRAAVAHALGGDGQRRWPDLISGQQLCQPTRRRSKKQKLESEERRATGPSRFWGGAGTWSQSQAVIHRLTESLQARTEQAQPRISMDEILEPLRVAREAVFGQAVFGASPNCDTALVRKAGYATKAHALVRAIQAQNSQLEAKNLELRTEPGKEGLGVYYRGGMQLKAGECLGSYLKHAFTIPVTDFEALDSQWKPYALTLKGGKEGQRKDKGHNKIWVGNPKANFLARINAPAKGERANVNIETDGRFTFVGDPQVCCPALRQSCGCPVDKPDAPDLRLCRTRRFCWRNTGPPIRGVNGWAPMRLWVWRRRSPRVWQRR